MKISRERSIAEPRVRSQERLRRQAAFGLQHKEHGGVRQMQKDSETRHGILKNCGEVVRAESGSDGRGLLSVRRNVRPPGASV